MLKTLVSKHLFSKVKELSISALNAKGAHNCVKVKIDGVKTGQDIEIHNPIETILASLVTCETHTAFYQAEKNKFDLQHIDWVKVSCKYDSAGWLEEKESNKIEDIHMELVIKSQKSQKEVSEFFEKVERLCPIYRTLEAAGVKITKNLTVKK